MCMATLIAALARWLLRGIPPPLPRDVSPFFRAMEIPFPKDGNLLPKDADLSSDGNPLPLDGMPSSTGGEPLFRAMGTPLPKDGTAFPKDRKPLSEGVGTALPRCHESVTEIRRGCYQNVTNVLPEGCGPLCRRGNPFNRGMETPFPKHGAPLFEGL